MSRISSTLTSTSTSISQFLALQVSGLQVSGVLGHPDRGSEAPDRDPDLAVGVAVGVAVGDAKSQH
jgi:hypothetical protein